MTIVEITSASIRFAAMNLLAVREHSAAELYIKLSKRYQQPELIIATIKRLTDDGLQCDVRFAEAFIAMRKRQGKGPLLITMELKERSISPELINQFLQADSESWKILAATVRQKKFGQIIPQDAKEKARQIRFLTGRGFSQAAIQYALRYCD